MTDRPSFTPNARRTLPLVVAGALTMGCGLLNQEETSLLKLHGMHSGTPSDGEVPNFGLEGMNRVFENDLGWTITLFEVYITTTEVHFIKCDETYSIPLDMWWGPCAEDFIREGDASPIPVGGVNMEDGTYCTMAVVYGNYQPLPPDDPAHDPPANEELVGNTILIHGRASKDEEQHDFWAQTDEEFDVLLDISSIESGGPLYLSQEKFPVDVTVGKIYDQWFDGIDFSQGDLAEEELVDRVKASLANETIPVLGTTY